MVEVYSGVSGGPRPLRELLDLVWATERVDHTQLKLDLESQELVMQQVPHHSLSAAACVQLRRQGLFTGTGEKLRERALGWLQGNRASKLAAGSPDTLEQAMAKAAKCMEGKENPHEIGPRDNAHELSQIFFQTTLANRVPHGSNRDVDHLILHAIACDFGVPVMIFHAKDRFPRPFQFGTGDGMPICLILQTERWASTQPNHQFEKEKNEFLRHLQHHEAHALKLSQQLFSSQCDPGLWFRLQSELVRRGGPPKHDGWKDVAANLGMPFIHSSKLNEMFTQVLSKLPAPFSTPTELSSLVSSRNAELAVLLDQPGSEAEDGGDRRSSFQELANSFMTTVADMSRESGHKPLLADLSLISTMCEPLLETQNGAVEDAISANPRRIAVPIGSSGIGKSHLINSLARVGELSAAEYRKRISEEQQETQVELTALLEFTEDERRVLLGSDLVIEEPGPDDFTPEGLLRVDDDAEQSPLVAAEQSLEQLRGVLRSQTQVHEIEEDFLVLSAYRGTSVSRHIVRVIHGSAYHMLAQFMSLDDVVRHVLGLVADVDAQPKDDAKRKLLTSYLDFLRSDISNEPCGRRSQSPPRPSTRAESSSFLQLVAAKRQKAEFPRTDKEVECLISESVRRLLGKMRIYRGALMNQLHDRLYIRQKYLDLTNSKGSGRWSQYLLKNLSIYMPNYILRDGNFQINDIPGCQDDDVLNQALFEAGVEEADIALVMFDRNLSSAPQEIHALLENQLLPRYALLAFPYFKPTTGTALASSKPVDIIILHSYNEKSHPISACSNTQRVLAAREEAYNSTFESIDQLLLNVLPNLVPVEDERLESLYSTIVAGLRASCLAISPTLFSALCVSDDGARHDDLIHISNMPGFVSRLMKNGLDDRLAQFASLLSAVEKGRANLDACAATDAPAPQWSTSAQRIAASLTSLKQQRKQYMEELHHKFDALFHRSSTFADEPSFESIYDAGCDAVLWSACQEASDELEQQLQDLESSSVAKQKQALDPNSLGWHPDFKYERILRAHLCGSLDYEKLKLRCEAFRDNLCSSMISEVVLETFQQLPFDKADRPAIGHLVKFVLDSAEDGHRQDLVKRVERHVLAPFNVTDQGLSNLRGEIAKSVTLEVSKFTKWLLSNLRVGSPPDIPAIRTKLRAHFTPDRIVETIRAALFKRWIAAMKLARSKTDPAYCKGPLAEMWSSLLSRIAADTAPPPPRHDMHPILSNLEASVRQEIEAITTTHQSDSSTAAFALTKRLLRLRHKYELIPSPVVAPALPTPTPVVVSLASTLSSLLEDATSSSTHLRCDTFTLRHSDPALDVPTAQDDSDHALYQAMLGSLFRTVTSQQVLEFKTLIEREVFVNNLGAGRATTRDAVCEYYSDALLAFSRLTKCGVMLVTPPSQWHLITEEQESSMILHIALNIDEGKKFPARFYALNSPTPKSLAVECNDPEALRARAQRLHGAETELRENGVPKEWSAHWSRSWSHVYYFNNVTGESTFTCPWKRPRATNGQCAAESLDAPKKKPRPDA